MNKKNLIFVFFICIFLLFPLRESQAQIIKGEIFTGLNLTQVDGDQAYGYRHFGFHGGVGAIVPVYKKNNFSFDTSLEVLFNQKGSHQRPQYKDNGNGITGEYNLYMDYVEVPLMFYFTDKQLASIGIGASYGRLVKVREYEHGRKADYYGPDTIKYNINSNDFCVLAEARIRIYQRLKLGVRFQYSMAKVRTRKFYNIDNNYDCTRDQFNNVVTIRLVYVFNEDKSELVRDEYIYKGDPKFHQKAINRKLKKAKKKEAREARRKNK